MKDEYIRKADAVEETLKYIISSGVNNQSTWNECVRAIADTLQDMPSADVVPVVRCKECKFRENDDFCTGRGFPCQLVPDDGFCDKGERKE
jgi:hypothetical protein